VNSQPISTEFSLQIDIDHMRVPDIQSHTLVNIQDGGGRKF